MLTPLSYAFRDFFLSWEDERGEVWGGGETNPGHVMRKSKKRCR